MEVRSYQASDASHLGDVFYRAVREGASVRYSKDQVAAWSPHAPSGDRWRERLEACDTVVAVDGDKRIGFMAVDGNGYVDLAFVLPEVMGRGVSDAIYAVLEGRARAKGVECLTTQASLLAEPFFARNDWRVVRRQEVEINGVVLNNTAMEKQLTRCA